MSKIQTITVKNFKAISELTADFKGASAIVTGRNNSGKTSFLRGIVDRIRLSRPDLKVRLGEREGSSELVLDSGDRFVWQFDVNGKDKLTLITTDGAKTLVTKDLGAQFFPPLFDIDKFLQSPPKSQVAQLQKIVGLDFTDVDQRWESAYKARTARNEEAERWHTKVTKAIKCDLVTEVSMTDLHIKRAELTDARRKKAEELNNLFKVNQKTNLELRDAFEKAKKEIDNGCRTHNEGVDHAIAQIRDFYDAMMILKTGGYEGSEVVNWIESFKDQVPAKKDAEEFYPEVPVYIEEMPGREDLDKIDEYIAKCNKEIEEAIETNAKAKAYKEYQQLCKDVEASQDAALEADHLVKKIEQEKREMIEKASFPEGISINSEGITVDGFILDRQVLSTSKLYTAALRIASMNLGEVRSLHFDASFLDRNSLAEVNEWAEANDLQLLIERPDYDGGEIKFEILEG